MILIVGHGPSAGRVSHEFVDDQRAVVRLRRAIALIGSKTDVIVSSQIRYKRDCIEFWHLQGELLRMCTRRLKPFNPSFQKPSTGLCAAIIARDRYPDEDIGLIGFDYTLHPEQAQNWRHDVYAENACINTLDVTEL